MRLPADLRPRGHLHRRPGAAPDGDAHQDALLAGQPPGRGEGVVVVDLRRSRRAGRVRRTSGTKPAPMPWILCGPGAPPESTGESAGSTAIACSAGLARLEHLGHAGDGAAGADAGDDDVHPAVGVVPDLLRRGLAVDRGLAGLSNWPMISEPGISRRSSSARAIAPFMPFAPGGQHQLARRAPAGAAAARRHGVGHGEDQPDSRARRRRRPARCRCCRRSARSTVVTPGSDRPPRSARLDHRHADAVLDADAAG